MSLTSKQRAFLNSQAHTLKPIIQIGKNGLNDQIKTSVRQALDARELIKVTLLQNTDENIHEVAEILEEEIGVDTVQKIGRILNISNLFMTSSSIPKYYTNIVEDVVLHCTLVL